MPISLNQLIACGVDPTPARNVIDHLNDVMDRYQINTSLRIAAFVAQGMYESTNFTRFEENLYYTSAERLYAVFHSQFTGPQDAANYLRNPQKLANHVYDFRNGNGSEASGDGWLFRGRGIVQLTGRGNYRACDQSLNSNYEQNPDLVAKPEHAALTYGNFWFRNQCNNLADLKQIDSITKIINGRAMQGAQERRVLYARALQALA